MVTDNSTTHPTEAADTDPWWRRSVRIPFVVASVTALHVVVLLAYSLLAPTYRAPDEPLHVDLAHLFAEELHYPKWDERDTGAGILRSLDLVEFHEGSQHLEASAAPDRSERPSIEDLEEPPRPRGVNQLPQHPPLYYAVAGGIERGIEVVTGDPAFDLETWIYRVVSIAFLAPVPLIIFRVGRRLALPDHVTIAAMLVPLAVPNYLHIGSVVNNDSLLIALFCALTPLVIRLADGDVGPRAAALAGVVTGLALYTKGFALVMPVWVGAALALALARLGRDHLGRVVRAGLVYGGVMLATGGWWWIANVVRYGRLSASRYRELVQPIEDDSRDLLLFLRNWGELTTRRFWGEFGWFDVRIPSIAVIAASALVMVAITVACVRRDRVAGTPAATRLLVLGGFLLLVAVQFRNALSGYLTYGRFPALQGRYWFGAMVALAVLVALGLANLAPRLIRVLPLAVLVGAVAMNALAASAMLGHYWGAPGSPLRHRVRAVVAWAPLEGEVVAAGALLGLLVAGLTVAQLATMSLLPTGPNDGDPPHVTGSSPRSVAAEPSPTTV